MSLIVLKENYKTNWEDVDSLIIFNNITYNINRKET